MSDMRMIAAAMKSVTTPLGRARDGNSAIEKAVVVAWAQGSDPHPRQFPLVGSDFYGSSTNFEYEVRAFHPRLVVPERETVLAFGSRPGWSAESEKAPAPGERCPHCRGSIRPPERRYDPTAGRDVVDDPTAFVCPTCLASGYDDRLDAQRKLAGSPPAHKAYHGRVKAPGSRRERRAAGSATSATEKAG